MEFQQHFLIQDSSMASWDREIPLQLLKTAPVLFVGQDVYERRQKNPFTLTFHDVTGNSFQEEVSVHDPQVGGHVSVAP